MRKCLERDLDFQYFIVCGLVRIEEILSNVNTGEFALAFLNELH